MSRHADACVTPRPFGRLSGMVQRVAWQPLYARVRIGGGPGSGKTYGALQLAMGLRRAGGVIVLANCGEGGGEMHYAGMTDFWHVDVGDVAAAIAQDEGWRYRAREGTDPRAIAATVDELARTCPPGSVVVVDSLSDGWDATKSLADVIKDGSEKRVGLAWQEAGGYWSGLMETLDRSPIHLIVCVRAKTEPEVVKGRDGYTFHAPTALDFRGRDEHRMDLRFTVSSLHRVWSTEGRIEAFNERPPTVLDVTVGRRLAGYLASGQDPGDAPVDVDALPLPGRQFGPQSPAPAPAPPAPPTRGPTWAPMPPGWRPPSSTPPPAALAPPPPPSDAPRRVEPSSAVAGLLPGGAGILVDEAQEFTRVVAEPARRGGLSPGVVDALSGLGLFMPSPDASPETIAREAARYIDERRDEFLAWRAEARAVNTMTEAEAERRLLGCPQVPLGGDAAGILWENACAVIDAASGGTASLRGDGPGVGRRRALWVLAAEGGPRAHACRAFLAAFPGDAAAELAVVCSDDALALALEGGPSRKLYAAVARAVRPKGVDGVER